MNKLFSSSPICQNWGIAFIRIVIACFLILHGWEVFDSAKMTEYAGWDTFKNPSQGKLLVYLGKGSEFIAGCLLLLGLLTRAASLITVGTFIYITFFIGHGKFWYDDQHPFLFALFGLLFFFTGPGALSLDKMFFKKDE